MSQLSEALDITQPGDRLDGAVLDLNLASEMEWPVVDVLTAHGVPVVLANGYEVDAIPAEHVALPRCRKPADVSTVIQVLARSIARQ